MNSKDQFQLVEPLKGLSSLQGHLRPGQRCPDLALQSHASELEGGLKEPFANTCHSPADLILGFLQPELIVKSQLDPGALWGVEAPRQQEVPGVAAGEARTVDAAVPCHADGVFLSVQVCEVIALC